MKLFARQKKVSETDDKRQVRSPEASRNRAVFSYYQNRDERDSKRGVGRTAKAKNFIKHLPTYLALLVIVASVIYAFSLSSQARVVILNEQQNDTDGYVRETTEVYEAEIAKMLSKSVFSGNKATVNTESLERDISQRFAEVTDVAVVLPLLGRNPAVYLRVAEPSLKMKSGSKTFIIDEKGRAIADFDGVKTPPKDLIAINDKSGVEIELGKTVLTEDNVTFMREFFQQLKRREISVKTMELPPSANELRIHLTNSRYYIKANLIGEARAQAGSFLATRQHLINKNIVPKSYVDVRVEERVYYQ